MSVSGGLSGAFQRFGEAWAHGDVDALADLLSPTYTHTDASGALLQRDQWLAYAAGRAGRQTQIAFHEVEIRLVADDVAVVTGVNEITGAGVRSSADQHALVIRFTQVWVRHDGRWLRESFQATPTSKASFV